MPTCRGSVSASLRWFGALAASQALFWGGNADAFVLERFPAEDQCLCQRSPVEA
ncbi:hypothetical protein [Synechococcus sp. NOUM97013]|uniref:hypothetical protein n=1 Tax=Synechococcus sp. NOUM97013 TaxID=1442555 RepID=UPI0016496461|nr:hypothetical protein [Synechococcus sp. NOUM97013]